jgi:hypothetical protein
MNPLSRLPEEDPFVKYFTDLGYSVDWDMSRRTGKYWYDITDSDGLMICQIDMGIPLGRIIDDLVRIRAGKPFSDGPDYTISGPETDELDELCDKAAANPFPRSNP